MQRNVLWFSRHKMTDEQLNGLKRLVGDDLELNQVNKTIGSVDEIQQDIDKADVLAVVAPPDLMQEFHRAADDRPLLSAVSERVLTKDGDGETKASFVFKGWKQYDVYQIESRMLLLPEDLRGLESQELTRNDSVQSLEQSVGRMNAY